MPASTGINSGGMAAIYLDDVKVVHSTNATLTISRGMRDITSKDSSNWLDKRPGMAEWSISGDFFFAEDAAEGLSEAFADIKDGTAVDAAWSTGNSGDNKYSGTAYCSEVSVSAGIDTDSQTWSMTYTGTGALTESTI
jgi:hypothetical protein